MYHSVWTHDATNIVIDDKLTRGHTSLRTLGVTVRKTIDCVIATRCIESGYDLLYNDRDFDPFVKHLGLRSVI